MSGQPRRRRPPSPLDPGAPAQTPAAEPSSPSRTQDPPPPTPASKKRRRRRKRRPAKDPKATESTDQPVASKRRPRAPTKAELAARATSTRKEVSAGGVVYRRNDSGGLDILLAARRTLKGNIAWGLAKGHIEEGESPEEAAVREVREETGWDALIEESLGLTKYFYVWENVRIRKTVHFFLMKAVRGDPGERDDEMEEIRWFPLERALKRAAYRGERDILVRAADLLG